MVTKGSPIATTIDKPVLKAEDLSFKFVEDKKISFKGFKYYYRVMGVKPIVMAPILVLSGAFQNMDSWKKYSAYFSQKTTVILVDLPGTGNSSYVKEDTSVDFQKDCVKEVMDELNLSKANVVATSYGTPIAHRFAQTNPERIDRLILAGTMKEIPLVKKKEIAESIKSINEDEKKFTKQMCDILLAEDKSSRIKKFKLAKRILSFNCMNLTERYKKHYIINSKRLLLLPALNLKKRPKVPTLVFTGEYDPFTKPEYCKEIACSFDNAIFTTIKGADHLFHIEQFSVTKELLDKFFSNESLDTVSGLGKIEYLKAV